MTPQQLKAMKLALEALEDALNKPMWNRPKMTEAITAINEALADHAMQEVQRLGQEIEQEPVAWMLDGEFYKTQQFHLQGGHYANQIPLYTTPPQRTEQEPVAWPCLIDSADFSENTITLVMQCEDYKVTAGPHWLSTIPTKENT